MVLVYMSNKVVAARATTIWSSTVLLFSNVIVADYFISFVFVTAEWTDPWFWGALVFDYALLVLRDSNSWGTVANMITKWFGITGHVVIVAAEAAAGNVEGIGDRIEASFEEQMGIIEKNKAKAEATQTARHAVLISSEVLHSRWRYEMWNTHCWYLALAAFTILCSCTFWGSMHIQQSGGCRNYCHECRDRDSCNMRGEDCSWEVNPNGSGQERCSQCSPYDDSSWNCRRALSDVCCKRVRASCSWDENQYIYNYPDWKGRCDYG
mmetsp:Transcript_10658/g.21194  ORF Transcript_10658/g.21194 Transcript_10658/m.21194 type:complete len:266 (-) Transcript_10658:144-941(-)